MADFTGGYQKKISEFWFTPAENAGIYDIKMAFSFLERRSFTADTIKRTIEWPLGDGSYYSSDLAHHTHDDAYVVYYRPDDLYEELEKALGNDTMVPGLRRYITDNPIVVTVQAGGKNQ